MIDRRRVIQTESDRFGAVLAGTDTAAHSGQVGTRAAAGLLRHLTGVHRFWATVIGERLTGPEAEEAMRNRPPLPDDPALAQDARRQATGNLLTALCARQPSETAWSWFPPDQTVGFTWRMQTHEATMHRVDAELTAGVPVSPIGAEVAADGIDHVIDVMWAWVPPGIERHVTGTVQLRSADTGRTWLVHTFRWTGTAWGQAFTDQIGCERAAAGEPDAIVTGTAEDLDLLVWGRAGQHVTRSGDGHALLEFQQMLDDGIR